MYKKNIVAYENKLFYVNPFERNDYGFIMLYYTVMYVRQNLMKNVRGYSLTYMIREIEGELVSSKVVKENNDLQ
jgi:hypothetical protein